MPEELGRTERKRVAITEAATELFLREGYRGTSMDDIAAGAGVSKQTVYKQFTDKEQLFCHVVEALVNVASDPVYEAVRGLHVTGDLETELRGVARRQLELVLEPRLMQLRRLVIAESTRFPQPAGSRGRGTSPAPGPRPRLRPAGLRGRGRRTRATWSSTPGSTRTGVSMGTDRNALVPDAPGPRSTRTGSVTYGGKLYYDPGHPAVRALVEDAIMDAVARYDLDARALRRLLLPLPGGRPGLRRRRDLRAVRRGLPGRARLAAAQHRPAGPGAGRRDQGGQAVGEVRGQPVRGVAQPGHRPARAPPRRPGRRPTTTCTPTPGSGCARSGSTTSPRRSTGTSASPPADYGELVPWWADQVRGTDVQLYVGQATYKVGHLDPGRRPGPTRPR